MNSINVLVGMPFQNNLGTLPRVLDSLINLEYPKTNLRLMFVDGGSTDGSVTILQQFESDHRSEYSQISIVQGKQFQSLPKSRNYCMKSLKEGEYVWFLDSDVEVTPNALNVLLGMREKFDIAALYYTHDRSEDPPQASGVVSVRAARTGCTLISPKTIKRIGYFNEKFIHEIEDTDYCLRAREAGLKVGFDEIHEQRHLKADHSYPWYHTITRTIVRRRSRAWWFGNKTFTRRWILYFLLLGLLILTPINPLFALPTLTFFLYQLAKGERPASAFARTVVALLVPPTSIYAMFEITFRRKNAMKTGEIDLAFK